MKLKEIASEIDGYLKRFEASSNINRRPAGSDRLLPYFQAGAWASGRYVGVRYVSFQTRTFLPRDIAEKYLDWLRRGGIGKHFTSWANPIPSRGRGKNAE